MHHDTDGTVRNQTNETVHCDTGNTVHADTNDTVQCDTDDTMHRDTGYTVHGDTDDIEHGAKDSVHLDITVLKEIDDTMTAYTTTQMTLCCIISVPFRPPNSDGACLNYLSACLGPVS